jgi:hypothetical protein
LIVGKPSLHMAEALLERLGVPAELIKALVSEIS